MKRVLLIVISLLVAVSTMAQRSDSLSCGYDHTFEPYRAIAPAILITSGSFITGSEYLRTRIDVPIQEWSQRDGHDPFLIEDYVVLAPLVAVPTLKLCGLESQHGWRDMACLTAGSVILTQSLCFSVKFLTRDERPYGGVYTSFPSAHTATAFMGAEILRREYGEEYPGIAIAGYAVATGVGCMRIYNNRHWTSDVLAGAGFGILSASLMYWLSPYLRF